MKGTAKHPTMHQVAQQPNITTKAQGETSRIRLEGLRRDAGTSEEPSSQWLSISHTHSQHRRLLPPHALANPHILVVQ